MAKSDPASEIKELFAKGKLVLGTERAVKLVKQGKLKRVIVSANCNPASLKLLQKYSEIGKFELEVSKFTNEKLGTLCKKPFVVSVIGILE